MIAQFRKWVPRGRFAKGAFLIAGASVLGQGIFMLTSPVITRLYTPEQFGILGAYASILSVLAVIAGLTYETAIPIPKHDREAIQVFGLSVVIAVLIAAISSLGIWYFSDAIIRWIKEPSLKPFLGLVPVGVLLVGISQSFNYWAIRKQEFERIARTKISQGTSTSITQLAAGFMGIGAIGLLLGDLLGRIAGTSTLAIQAWQQDRGLVRFLSFEGMRKVAIEYRRFPLMSGPSRLINSSGTQLPILILTALYGVQAAGLYVFGYRIVGGAISLLGQSIYQVYSARLSKLAELSPQDRKKLVDSLNLRLLKISLPASLGLMLLAPFLFSHVFGKQWAQAGLYISVLMPTIALTFIINPSTYVFNALQRQDIELTWNIARMLLIFLSLWIPSRLGLDSFQAISIYSATTFLTYLALLGLVYWALNHPATPDELEANVDVQ